MEERFGEIYDQYVVKIYRFIVLKVDSQEVAEDLCSEVFTRVFQEFQKQEIQNMQAFLYQVARHIIADYYRDRASFRIVRIEEAEGLVAREHSLLEKAATLSEIEEVKQALANLRDEYQNLIIWRYLDELSIPEIAQLEGKSEGSVRVSLHRAMEALRGKLEVPKDAPSVPV